MNHQIHKTQTTIETVEARLRDLTNVAAELWWAFIMERLVNWEVY